MGSSISEENSEGLSHKTLKNQILFIKTLNKVHSFGIF